MSDMDPNGREPGPQPDPMLRRGRLDPLWLWMTVVIMAGVVVATLFAVSPRGNQTAANAPQPPQTEGRDGLPKTALAPGRETTGAATADVNGTHTVRAPQGGNTRK